MSKTYEFFAFGHENILATHAKTFEFTKDEHLTLRGDCIIGVNSDFDLAEIKKIISRAEGRKIKIFIDTVPADKNVREEINGELNPNFLGSREFVVRKTGYVSERTFAINADKSSLELNRGLIKYLKFPKNKIKIKIEFF